MSPERWQQVKQIFQSAIERSPSERDRFILEACDNNLNVRTPVQSLISSYDQAETEPIEALAVHVDLWIRCWK